MERLGGYISRSVNTVSGPFHPFGGAVDIVVVQQQDGSYKSSPWYVRFGKFQGVLKAKERMVNISVNGAEADFHMYLDHKGEAFFISEMDSEDGESILYPSSSSDDTDTRPQDNKRLLKSESCNFETDRSSSVAHVDINDGKLLTRTTSRPLRLLGLVFNRRSMKGDNGIRREVELNRVDSFERAEIAANLLELKWSTNLAGCKPARKYSIKTLQSSPFHDNTENALGQYKLNEEGCYCSKQEGIGCSNSEFEGTGEEERVNPSCLSTQDKMVEHFVAGESFPEGKAKVRAEVSIVIGVDKDSQVNPNWKEVVYDSSGSDLEVACAKLETHFEKQPSGEEVSGISGEELSANGNGSFVYCKPSERLMMGTDCSTDQTREVLYLSSSSRGCECEQVHVQAEILHATTVLLPEVTKSEEDVKNVDLGMPVEASEFHSQETDFFHSGVRNNDMAKAKDPTMMPNPQIFNLDPELCSLEEVQSNCVAETSCYSCLGKQGLDENEKENDDSSMLSSPQVSIGDCVLSNATSRPPPKEEQTHSSDIDKCQITDLCNGSISPDFIGKDHISYVDGIEKVNQVVDTHCDSHSSPESSTTKSHMDDLQELGQTCPIVIPRNKAAWKEVGLLTESLPKMYSHSDSLNKHYVSHPLSQSLDSKAKSLKWTSPAKNNLKRLKSEGDKENHLLNGQFGEENHGLTGFKSNVLNPPIGDPSRLNPSPGGNWGLWPFSFRRSRSGKTEKPAPNDAKNTTSSNASESTIGTDAEKDELKPNPRRRKVRTKTPTSEQLASLNLKKGRNTVTFTFSTNMLGKQQVDAQIYLWKWNTRIVISDVDGTITRSDVLGQFMPLVGVDWSQTGVAHLYSAIKENDYQLLFLSARAISQAYHTRQFLFNLNQNGKVLPEGPVLISPDGLFPSLYREVIRRAPHEFKIACLEDIKALFPSDCNPFYAGFGNRDTDEISYLKVGIPKGKIFIINPKGEIAVNRRLDTKSYTSLHALVNGMFPATNSSEKEDFNSWNFWKLPPVAVDT
ncbi:hypothetical protein QN277_017886 [Acacia crassicarpa]|uniref:LNS2/PITP domain-containing protein n=1 Tax=Acacia crassicarpa TaxID=499986 RepID=A0AAE1KGT4_9FABA|nr:hypothetical protein QN277_017886 [Acacia crassicarpa]